MNLDSALTVRGLAVHAVDVPMDRPLITGGGEVGSAAMVLIDLMTEEGITGCSYLFCPTPLVLEPLAKLLSNLAPLIEGDPLAPLVAQGIVDRDGDDPGRQEVGEDQQAQQDADLVPLPAGAGEEGVDGVEVHPGAQAGELPDLGEGAAAQAQDPGGHDRLEDGERLGAGEADPERAEQFGQRNNNMIHG